MTINILDKVLTVEEARKIYNELDEIFGKTDTGTYPVTVPYTEPYINPTPWKPNVWYSTGTEIETIPCMTFCDGIIERYLGVN